MKLDEAKRRAQKEAVRYGIPMVVVNEGPHRDEFEADNPSYGYCFHSARKTLYLHGEEVAWFDEKGVEVDMFQRPLQATETIAPNPSQRVPKVPGAKKSRAR